MSLTYSSDIGRSGVQPVGKKLKKKCCRSKPQCKRCPVPFLLKERDKARKKARGSAEHCSRAAAPGAPRKRTEREAVLPEGSV